MNDTSKPKLMFTVVKVVTMSTNTNSFGLRGVIIATRDGRAWEICCNQLAVDRLKAEPESVATIVNGQLSSVECITFEIDRPLQPMPKKVILTVFGSDCFLGKIETKVLQFYVNKAGRQWRKGAMFMCKHTEWRDNSDNVWPSVQHSCIFDQVVERLGEAGLSKLKLKP